MKIKRVTSLPLKMSDFHRFQLHELVEWAECPRRGAMRMAGKRGAFRQRRPEVKAVRHVSECVRRGLPHDLEPGEEERWLQSEFLPTTRRVRDYANQVSKRAVELIASLEDEHGSPHLREPMKTINLEWEGFNYYAGVTLKADFQVAGFTYMLKPWPKRGQHFPMQSVEAEFFEELRHVYVDPHDSNSYTIPVTPIRGYSALEHAYESFLKWLPESNAEDVTASPSERLCGGCEFDQTIWCPGLNTISVGSGKWTGGG